MQERKKTWNEVVLNAGPKKLSIYNEDYINLVKVVMPQIVALLKLLSLLQAAALQLY